MPRKKAIQAGENELQRPRAGAVKVGEARAEYVVDAPPRLRLAMPMATTRLSSKNQITLPVVMIRALDLEPGDEVDLIAIGDMICLERAPKTHEEWEAKVVGAMAHVPEWQTEEGIDTWVRNERDSWDRQWDKEWEQSDRTSKP